MTKETKHNVKQTFETLAVAVVCTVFVLSMHQSCSGLAKQFGEKDKTENKNAQNIKNDTIKSVQEVKSANTIMFNDSVRQKVR